MKKLVGVVAVLAVTVFGTEARSEQAPAPAQGQAAPAHDETLTLNKGEVRILDAKDITRVALGSQEFADVATGGDGSEKVLRVTGVKKGETTLLVWTKDGKRKSYRLVIQG
ncbi:pilus assembly protein N-terminal domain-containing protein [Vitiosangium sp. GDMCC 1.1324]|uniref:pilus assembly protein N-terminal domain-containing protein n=1 Tax=Vitiosangium sp. (strain GDMCC 1.1324) TaxID=2138576 RepID=UPI00130D762C|nr:pilus assembly protein N-terminal domain-containing protein [Vitiosangium sp. GDMCC 1.1324]